MQTEHRKEAGEFFRYMKYKAHHSPTCRNLPLLAHVDLAKDDLNQLASNAQLFTACANSGASL